MRVLIILGHPRKDSFCAALARAFCTTLQNRSIEFRLLDLADLNFDPNVRGSTQHEQSLEPDLEQARQSIAWGDHLVFVYPIWWGMMPALLKGFLDRILLPGFAFRDRESGSGYEGLLGGKSAQLLTTMDTPPWVVRWLLGRPGHRAFEVGTLRFCGIRPVRIRMFGPIKGSTGASRSRWLETASREAELLRGGRLAGSEAFWDRVSAWMKALRLPFYPMSWLAYTAGAAMVVPLPTLWRQPVYWWSYAVLFLIEAITVFLNEIHDFETDRRNPHSSPFNGGSRVLVEGRLTAGELRRGCVIAGTAAVVAASFAVAESPAPPWAVLVAFVTTLILGIGYTVPPLKFSHRGAGEIVVAFTHSLLVIQCGALVLGGPVGTRQIWQLGVPLFLAVLPAITLSALPDRGADEAAGKRTLAVKFGPRSALALAMATTAASAGAALVWDAHWPRWAAVAMVCHAAAVLAMAAREWRNRSPRRIDALLIVALSYIIWFVAVPLFAGS